MSTAQSKSSNAWHKLEPRKVGASQAAADAKQVFYSPEGNSGARSYSGLHPPPHFLNSLNYLDRVQVLYFSEDLPSSPPGLY